MTGAASAHRLTVYSRQGCHLCNLMLDALRGGCAGCPIEVVDVDRDPGLVARYGSRVPVLVIDGREICHFRLDQEALKRALRGS